MKYHQTEIRVRYSETDQMQVVYHGNYAQYFEIGRVEWLRYKGLSYKWLEENGIMLPVVSLTINYKKSAIYDELLTLRTSLKSRSTVKIEFEYELYNERSELLTIGNSILVFVDMKTKKPICPPKFISEILETDD